TIDIAGASTVTVSGAVTTLTTSAAIGTLTVNENITTLNVNTGGITLLQINGKTVSNLNINSTIPDISAGAGAKISTITLGTSGAITNALGTAATLTIDAIDQSAIAADKTFALGNMSTAITSVKAHATNTTTITGSALSGLTITQGVVNVSGATSSALNIAATAAATVNATSKTINNISGSAPIILNGAGAVTAATVTGATSDLTIAAGTTVTTLTINASQTLTKLTIDGTTNIASDANAVINTLTVGSAGILNPIMTTGNLTITNIDQSAVAADKSINLGDMTTAVSSVRGHSTNALTLTAAGTPTVTITAGTVNVQGCAGILNVAATSSTTVLAATKDLASVSGPTTINIQGAVNATITGAITTLGVTDGITSKLAVNAAVDTINIKDNVTVVSMELDAAVNTLTASGAAAAITTLTLKTSGSIANALATAGNLTTTNIDQSAIAADKTIQLGNMTTAVSSVRGHATNSLTLSATGTPTLTIARGVVDVSNCAGTLNVTATAATKVTATARTLAAVSGAQTIELAGASAATISGAVTTLNVTGAVTTLNINNSVTNSTIAFNSASTQTLAIGAAGILNQGGGTGLTVSNVTQGHKITVANGGKIFNNGGANGVYAVTLGAGTGKTITTATVTGIALAGTSPNATLAGTAAGAVTVNIAAGTGNITNP
ncbi:MAG TPA: hypothetical protein PKL57_09745, partial [Candidatus Wallbacteria bacterium]|nr:hypothetical protein [Candidatus Wallbacteria bacterium]